MWTTVGFEDSSSILIQGNNGSGKSAAILDSLTFVLFGKPFRKVNKHVLVNNRNKKDMVVEVWFNDEKNQYHIVRGMNPGIFEIYKDNELIDQDARTGDYQAYLERQILKMDFRTFTQIVVLGKATYVAFLRLAAGDRRRFIESILNLIIFGTMGDITYARLSKVKNRLVVLKNSIALLKNQISMLVSHIKDFEQASIKRQVELQKDTDEQVRALRDEIALVEKEIELKRAEVTAIDGSLDALQQKLDICYDLKSKMKGRLADTRKKIKFFSSNSVCPTCDNNIDAESRALKIEEFNRKEQELTNAHEQLERKTESVLNCVKEIQACIEKNRKTESKITLLEHTIQQKLDAIAQAESRRNAMTFSDSHKIKEYKDDLERLTGEVEGLSCEKTLAQSQQECYEFVQAMLKDNGIKTTIIRRHIPNIVSTMNHYLRALGLFVKFDLNENFEESLLGRGIDQVPYNAYSEGEKLRIDLAMLLTWRQLAKGQNNLSVNFIIFDEILDSSADDFGIESLIDIFKIMKSEGTKIFVISHSDHWTDKFDKIWTIEKSGGFSSIKNS